MDSYKEFIEWLSMGDKVENGCAAMPLRTQQRDQVSALAASSPNEALDIARAIEDPWFACQAFAHIAWHAPKELFDERVAESLAAGRHAIDPYDVVGSAAWPIAAMVQRGRVDAVSDMLPNLLTRATSIEVLASRSEALFHLLQAVYPAGESLRLLVFRALLAASEPLISWCQKRNLRDAILMIWNDHPSLAQETLNGISDRRTREQTERRVEKQHFYTPRRYF